MAVPTLARQLAKTIVDALKRADHIVLAGGEGDAVLREIAALIDPVLERILPRVSRSPVMGEVTSTFGDEQTDEAVEQLVEQMREALLDSDGVEDVYADDRTIERLIFRCLADEMQKLGEKLDDIEETVPPISVRLDTLGYVAAHAAKGADSATLEDALDRAAEVVKSELERYDPPTRTAFFRPSDPDPEQRLDIESAVEEELAELVDLGVVDLPTATRRVELPRAFDRAEQKTLFRVVDGLAQRHLSHAVCPGSWAWEGPSTILLTFTPLAEPDDGLIDSMAAAFAADAASITPDAGLGRSAPRPAPGAEDAGALALARAIANLGPAMSAPKAASERAPKVAPRRTSTAATTPKAPKKAAAAPKRPAAKPAAKQSAAGAKKKPR